MLQRHPIRNALILLVTASDLPLRLLTNLPVQPLSLRTFITEFLMQSVGVGYTPSANFFYWHWHQPISWYPRRLAIHSLTVFELNLNALNESDDCTMELTRLEEMWVHTTLVSYSYIVIFIKRLYFTFGGKQAKKCRVMNGRSWRGYDSTDSSNVNDRRIPSRISFFR